MTNIYLEITEGIITNHWNYPEGTSPSGLVKAPEEYQLGWGFSEAEGVISPTYDVLRATEYATLNQFEMQFDDQRDGTSTWVDAINAIKNRNPK